MGNFGKVSRNMPYTVYAVRCSMTNKMYIGVTGNVERRMRAHYAELSGGLKTSHLLGASGQVPSAWQIDFNRYGKSAFDVFILETDIPFTEREVKERYWINLYRTYDPRFGYNNIGKDQEEATFCICPGKPPLPPIEAWAESEFLRKEE